MKKKGFMGIPLLTFGFVVVAIIAGIILFLFLIGFLDNAVDGIRNAIIGLLDFFKGFFSGGGY